MHVARIDEGRTVKSCEVCGYVANDRAPTCPNCGEASWSSLTPAPAPAPAPEAKPEPTYTRRDERRNRR
jgi:hypothetical protein